MFLIQEYNYTPVRTRNSSTACGPQLLDVASLEGGISSSVDSEVESLQWRLLFQLHVDRNVSFLTVILKLCLKLISV